MHIKFVITSDVIFEPDEEQRSGGTKSSGCNPVCIPFAPRCACKPKRNNEWTVWKPDRTILWGFFSSFSSIYPVCVARYMHKTTWWNLNGNSDNFVVQAISRFFLWFIHLKNAQKGQHASIQVLTVSLVRPENLCTSIRRYFNPGFSSWKPAGLGENWAWSALTTTQHLDTQDHTTHWQLRSFSVRLRMMLLFAIDPSLDDSLFQERAVKHQIDPTPASQDKTRLFLFCTWGVITWPFHTPSHVRGWRSAPCWTKPSFATISYLFAAFLCDM